MSSVREELVRKLRIASKVRVVRNLLRQAPAKRVGPDRLCGNAGRIAGARRAASGRVSALAGCGAGRLHRRPGDFDEAGAGIRASFPAALLIVQHMPGTFTSQFAEQLASVAQFR